MTNYTSTPTENIIFNQTVHALNTNQNFLFLDIDLEFISEISFDYSINSIMSIDNFLKKNNNLVTEQYVKLFGFYIAEFLYRLTGYKVTWYEGYNTFGATERDDNFNPLLMIISYMNNLHITQQFNLIDLIRNEFTDCFIGLDQYDKLSKIDRPDFFLPQRVKWFEMLSKDAKKHLLLTPANPKIRADILAKYYDSRYNIINNGKHLTAFVHKYKKITYKSASLEIIYDPESRLNFEDMTYIQDELYRLQINIATTDQRIADNQCLKDHAKDYFNPLSLESIFGLPLIYTKIYVELNHTPKNTLAKSSDVPILYCPESNYLMLYPYQIWNVRNARNWNNKINRTKKMKRNIYILFFLTIVFPLAFIKIAQLIND